MAETVTGCVTMVSQGARSTGVWLLLNRRTRVYLPQSVGLVTVGDCVTVSGWREEDRKSWFVMAQQCEPAPLSVPGDRSGLMKALYGRGGYPEHAHVVLELIGPILRWLLAAGWPSVSKELAKGLIRTVRTIYQDVYVLYRRKGIPYQVAHYFQQLLVQPEGTLGQVQAVAADVLLAAETDGESGLTTALLMARVASALQVEPAALPEAAQVLVSSVGRCDEGVWYSPSLFFHRQRALTYLRGNQLQLESIDDPLIQQVLGHRYSVITGPAGSGKTQQVLRTADWCRTQGLRVAMTALTGQAASLLGPEGQTLHRLLGYGGGGFSVDQVHVDVVFVDEMSMLTWPLLSQLLAVCRDQIVFSGDPRQLPPVGSVSVMGELLDRLPALVLPPFLRDDPPGVVRVQTVQCLSVALVIEGLVRRVKACVARGAEWQVLSPVYDGDLGVTQVNVVLQAQVNQTGAVLMAGFRVGDRVVVTENCNELRPRVYNGMVGVVIGMRAEGLVVRLAAGREVTLPPKVVALAYCLSIHRAQGSRYDYVFVVMPTRNHGGFVQDPRLQEVARSRGREETLLLVC